MLTLKLKAGDSLMIGDSIKLIVRDEPSNSRAIKIAIDAPRNLNIERLPSAAPDK